MSTAAAQPAINTLLKLGNGASPEVFTTIANVGDLSGPGLQATVVDVTSHSTGVPWREKITTLLDGGDLSVPLYFIPSDTGHKQLLSIFTEKNGTTNGLRNYKLVFPDGAATTYAFSAYISKFSLKEPVAGVIEAAVTFTLTGQPTFPA